MSGVLYPDLARSFALGSQLRVQEEERGIDKEVNELVPAAMKGDQTAIENIARKRPNVAIGITGMLDKMDAGRRAKVKEASQWTAQAAMGILSLPEAERPAAYQAALSEGQRLGYQIDMPPQYDRAVDGRLRQILNQTRTFENYWKDKQEGFDLVPSGGGGAAPPATGGGGVNSFNIGNVRPVGGGPNSGFQQPASLDDGIRLAVNNVKAYPAKFNNGQPMTLMQIGARWAPVGDGANDPGQWARNVASIGGLDPNQPLDLNDPMTAAKFARGVHGAEHGANKVLPPERYAQAITGGAAPPGIAQGDTAPPADASGTPIPTSDGGSVPREVMRMITPNLPPGTSLGRDRKTGLFKVQEGKFVVYDGNKNPVALVDIPKTKEQGTGPFTGNSVEAQALNMLIANGTLTQPQAADLAAGKSVTDPATGQIIFKTPSGIFGQSPGQAAPQPLSSPQGGAPMAPAGVPAGVPAPAAPAVTVPANPGSIPLTGARPTKSETMTEGQANAALYADRMREADAIIAANEKAGMSVGGKALEVLPGGVGNFLQSDAYQLFEQARRNFINAVLRRESGAVIADTEFANAEKQYFPRPGDSKAVLEQKAANRRSAIKGIARAAGPAYKPQGAPQSAAEKGRDEFNVNKIPAPARDRLKANPAEAAQFDEIFGKGAAAAVLGR